MRRAPSTGKMQDDATILEKRVEKRLTDGVKKLGGQCVKLNPRNAKGIPDRLVVLPGCLAFVELKRPVGGRLSVTQKLWKKWLTEAGAEVHIIATLDAVDQFLRENSMPKPKTPSREADQLRRQEAQDREKAEIARQHGNHKTAELMERQADKSGFKAKELEKRTKKSRE